MNSVIGRLPLEGTWQCVSVGDQAHVEWKYGVDTPTCQTMCSANCSGIAGRRPSFIYLFMHHSSMAWSEFF